MAKRPVNQLTLREMFSDAERITQKLIEHLDQGFLPKVRHLERLVRPTDTEAFAGDVLDVTVRNHADRVLESEVFTNQFVEELTDYCSEIDRSASRIVDEG